MEPAEYHVAQGLLGLATAGETWSAPGLNLKGLPGFWSNCRREIINGQRGIAYIGPPPHSRYPDLIFVNGTEYRSINTSALEFQSKDGRFLDALSLDF